MLKIGGEKEAAAPPPKHTYTLGVDASGCWSHYQQGLVVGKAVREAEYCCQG